MFNFARTTTATNRSLACRAGSSGGAIALLPALNQSDPIATYAESNS